MQRAGSHPGGGPAGGTCMTLRGPAGADLRGSSIKLLYDWCLCLSLKMAIIVESVPHEGRRKHPRGSLLTKYNRDIVCSKIRLSDQSGSCTRCINCRPSQFCPRCVAHAEIGKEAGQGDFCASELLNKNFPSLTSSWPTIASKSQ